MNQNTPFAKTLLSVTAIATIGSAFAQPVMRPWTRTADYFPAAGPTMVISSCTASNGAFVTATNESSGKTYLAFHSRTAGNVSSTANLVTPQYPSPRVVKVIPDTAGHVYALAFGPVTGKGATNNLIVYKVNAANGAIVWAQNDGIAGADDVANDIVLMRLGTLDRVAILGTTAKGGGGSDLYISRISGAGTIEASTAYTNAAGVNETGLAIAMDMNGQVYVGGTAGGQALVATFSSQLVLQFDRLSQIINGVDAICSSVVADGVGNAIFAGEQANGNSWIQKIGVGGMVTWGNAIVPGLIKKLQIGPGPMVHYGGQSALNAGDFMFGRMALAFGAPLMSQTFNSGPGREDVFVDFKVDPFGEYICLGGTRLGLGTVEYLVTKHSSVGGLRWGHRWLPIGGTDATPSSLSIHAGSGDVLAAGENAFVPANNNVRILCLRQAAVAINDGYVMKKNTVYSSPKAVTTNDRNFQGATITVQVPPANGTLNLLGNGLFVYTPNPGFTGQDTWSYRLTKPGLNAGVGVVTMTVN